MDKAKVTLRGQWGFSQLASNDNWMMMKYTGAYPI